MSETLFAIDVVCRRTGLSAHVVRVWERRYGAVAPRRTATKRRLYSETDVRRLGLLRRAVEAGHRIGVIAKLPEANLLALVGDQEPNAGSEGAVARASAADPAQFYRDRALAAVQSLDSRGLYDILERAVLALGSYGLLARVIAPLAETVGDLWQSGELTAAHEHFLSSAVKVFLGQLASQFVVPGNAPALVVATPTGQLHELGAVLAATAASNVGWRVTYLGASLPAAEIAGAALQLGARAVALSLVYPPDDAGLANELAALRRFLPRRIDIVVGGRAASNYAEALRASRARPCDDLDQFIKILSALRLRPAKNGS